MALGRARLEQPSRYLIDERPLAAGLGAEIRLRADGPDEEAAMAAMVDLFERKFDEGQ